MTVVIELVESIVSPGFTPLGLRTIEVSATRNGLETPVYKEAVLWNGIHSQQALVTIPLRDGVHASHTFIADAVDGQRALILYDYDPAQPYAAIRTPNINADIHLQIDLNDGTGGGSEPTVPATAPAVVRVERLPAAREVVAVERKADGTWRYAGTTLVEGAGQLDVQVTGGALYVMAADDYGIPFQTNLTIAVGATIRPSAYAGWLYRCTEAGQLPAEEPEWWPAQGDNPAREVGTARLQAVRYYQPIAHGPVNYELV